MAASEGEPSILTILRKKMDYEQSINVTIDCNWLLITLTKGSCNKAVNSLGSVGSAGLAGSAVYSLQFRRFSIRYFGICQFFLQYWGIGYPPMSPSFREELKSRDSQVLIPQNKWCASRFKGESVNHLFCTAARKSADLLSGRSWVQIPVGPST